jgi:putative membrane protein
VRVGVRREECLVIIVVWILNAVALLAVAFVLPGIAIASFWSAMLAALVLGFLNTMVKPFLILLTLPITIVTLGLFLLVLNALVFWLAGSVLRGFQVEGFWWAVAGALLYSAISGLFSMLLFQQ